MAKLPIRNKSDDNPYTLGFDENKNIYTVEFKDNKRVLHKVEISEKVYKAFDSFELEDVSQIHKFQRHIEHSEIFEDSLNTRAKDKPLGVDEIVEKNILFESIKEAINLLPEIQKRRIKKYFFEDKTYEEIAQEENCTKMAIKFSIDSGLEKISKKLKK